MDAEEPTSNGPPASAASSVGGAASGREQSEPFPVVRSRIGREERCEQLDDMARRGRGVDSSLR